MKSVRITNTTRATDVGTHCDLAKSIWTRMRGLLGRKSLAEGEGLLIEPCSSIHMLGMSFAIDVLFLTRDHQVTDLVENIRPGKLYAARGKHGKAYSALELPAGTIARTGSQRGDQLRIEPL